MNQDIIRIQNMHVQCYIGIHRHERHERQTLLVDVEMYLDPVSVSEKITLSNSVDYSKIFGELKFLLEASQFRLLETAAQALCAYLLAPAVPDRPQAKINAVKLTLSKPSALKSEAVPSLTIYREAGDFNPGHEINHFGEVDIIHESNDCGIYRLKIPEGGTIPAHYHEVMSEGEMCLSDGLLLQNKPITAGLAHFWPQKFVHEYKNPTEITRTVLCVNRPAFIPSDEILSPDAPLLDPPPGSRVRYY